MNRLQITAFGLALCLAAGCSAPPEPTITTTPTSTSGASSPTATAAAEPAFQAAVSESQKLELTPSHQKMDVRPDTKRSSLVLGNYDFELKPKTANSLKEISDPAQMRVHVSFKHRQDASFDNPITVGDYDAKTANVDFYVVENGRQKILNMENEQGTLVVTAVEGDQVSGKLDLTGDKGALVKGDFQATMVR